ncbi:winged helix-turn-helix domain-containing protein [Vibrio maritimus]|uniref:winged helix-turn-helix domain-containing protein n=1 Tax=Vibrio maritimus TaxID=990268 RepID=UPI0040690624
MKNQKIQFEIDDWIFIPSEDKFILHHEEFIIDHRLSRLFHFFCDNPHTVFSRDELINEVWNGSILTDQVITQAIFELRKILKQHGSHPFGYIVTVPKRGYKLDAMVQKVIETPGPIITNEPAKLKEGQEENVTQSHVEDDDLFVQSDQSRENITFKLAPYRWWLLGAALLTTLLVVHHYFQSKPPTTLPKTVESTITPSYLSYEPRYIYVVSTESFLNDHLKVGIARKLLDYLKTYRDYRIIYDGPAAKVAANELRFTSIERNGHQYLEIEYLNRVSGDKHLDRRYRISEGYVRQALERSLEDLLDSFNIGIGKSQVEGLINELPESEEATSAALESLGAAFQAHYDEKALHLIEYASKIAPENQYVISTAYMFKLSEIYLRPTEDTLNKVKALNADNGPIFEHFEQTQPLTPRLLEAMSMMAMSKDNPLEAKRHLVNIAHDRRSIMFYILSAKIAESTGNRSAAEEFYYHAILEASTVQVLSLSEVLFFNSDLSDIRNKITSNLADGSL